jgi:tRNA(Ile2) C34 agmatinyltransferase TiaS
MSCLGGIINKIQVNTGFQHEWTECENNNPTCPNCAGVSSSNGVKWICKECGKQWMKHYQPKVDFDSRPSCINCGGKPRSHGRHWECRICGKSWKK